MAYGKAHELSTRSRGGYHSEIKKCQEINSGEVLMKCCPYEWFEGDGYLNKGDFSFLTGKISYIEFFLDENDSKGTFINLLDKKKNFLKKIEKYVAVASGSGSSGGCFLTTVCVNHRGLTDNCYELKTLRNFRDTYMRMSPDGDQLIEQYYHDGPKIVSTIIRHPRKDAILSEMYNSLVKPSIRLIEQNKLEEARKFYMDYTRELKMACNPILTSL